MQIRSCVSCKGDRSLLCNVWHGHRRVTMCLVYWSRSRLVPISETETDHLAMAHCSIVVYRRHGLCNVSIHLCVTDSNASCYGVEKSGHSLRLRRRTRCSPRGEINRHECSTRRVNSTSHSRHFTRWGLQKPRDMHCDSDSMQSDTCVSIKAARCTRST